MNLHCEPKQQDTELLPITFKMLTDFKNPFTDRLSGKSATNLYLNIPQNLKRVATLPCEIFVLKQSQCSKSNQSKLPRKTQKNRFKMSHKIFILIH